MNSGGEHAGGVRWGLLMRGHVEKLLVVGVGVRLVRDALDLELHVVQHFEHLRALRLGGG